MSIGQNLQFLRKMRRMTQEELAEKLSVSRQTVSKWELDTACPEIDKVIGWDFLHLSQEQINVYNMHGYAAALILPQDAAPPEGMEMFTQSRQQYAAITIREPSAAPFTTIPNAYTKCCSPA